MINTLTLVGKEAVSMDKRNFLRVNYHVKARLDYDGKEICGNVVNMSINGIGIETANTEIPPEKAEVDLVLVITGDGAEIKMNVASTVIRSEQRFLGLRFNSVDLDTFIHIRNIVAFNSGDYDTVMEEFINNKRQNEI